MDYYLSINRAEILWAFEKLMREKTEYVLEMTKDAQELRKSVRLFDQDLDEKSLKETKTVALQIMLQTVAASPALAIDPFNIIYLQKDMPEELIPLILNHEELHLLTNRILREDGLSPGKAKIIGDILIDSEECRHALTEVFNIDYKVFKNYLDSWTKIILFPHLRILNALKFSYRGLKFRMEMLDIKGKLKTEFENCREFCETVPSPASILPLVYRGIRSLFRKLKEK